MAYNNSTIIILHSNNELEQNYFISIVSSIVHNVDLSDAGAISHAISSIADIFHSFDEPQHNTSLGIWSELFIMDLCGFSLIEKWRSEKYDLYDFQDNQTALEVKATSKETHSHYFSAGQLNIPRNKLVFVASILTKRDDNDVTIGMLMHRILKLIPSLSPLRQKLLVNIYSGLGKQSLEAMSIGYRFDLAKNSLRFIEASVIPSIPERYHSDISNISFCVNCENLLFCNNEIALRTLGWK